MTRVGIAIWRWIALGTDSRKVSAQLKRDSASTDNPLGRVLASYESNQQADTETVRRVEALMEENRVRPENRPTVVPAREAAAVGESNMAQSTGTRPARNRFGIGIS